MFEELCCLYVSVFNLFMMPISHLASNSSQLWLKFILWAFQAEAVDSFLHQTERTGLPHSFLLLREDPNFIRVLPSLNKLYYCQCSSFTPRSAGQLDQQLQKVTGLTA